MSKSCDDGCNLFVVRENKDERYVGEYRWNERENDNAPRRQQIKEEKKMKKQDKVKQNVFYRILPFRFCTKLFDAV